MKIALFVLLPVLLVVFSISVQAQTDEGHLMTKGMVTGNHFFSGQPVWTILQGDGGTLISTSAYGVAVAKLDIEKNLDCDEQLTIVCFSGVVTETKNFQRFTVGDTINFVFELPDKQKITIINDSLGEFELNVDINKLRVLKT